MRLNHVTRCIINRITASYERLKTCVSGGSETVIRSDRAEFLPRQCPSASICSYEHESIFPASLGANIAQIKGETSTVGVEFMDSAVKTLKAALEAVRDMAVNALNQVGQSGEECSMRWKCKECQYIKHFTRAVPLEAAADAPDAKVRRLIRFYETAATRF
jgi:hypothetical protein